MALKMQIGFSDLFEEGKDLGLKGKLISSIIQQSISEGLHEWYRLKLPGHFKHSAMRLYPGDYRPRDKKYSRKKGKQKGHQDPMVWTGEMRDMFLNGKPVTIGTGSRSKARGTIKFPFVRKANFWLGTQKRANSTRGPNFHDELTAFNQADYEWLMDRIHGRAVLLMQEEFMKAERRIRKKPAKAG